MLGEMLKSVTSFQVINYLTYSFLFTKTGKLSVTTLFSFN